MCLVIYFYVSKYYIVSVLGSIATTKHKFLIPLFLCSWILFRFNYLNSQLSCVVYYD